MGAVYIMMFVTQSVANITS